LSFSTLGAVATNPPTTQDSDTQTPSQDQNTSTGGGSGGGISSGASPSIIPVVALTSPVFNNHSDDDPTLLVSNYTKNLGSTKIGILLHQHKQTIVSVSIFITIIIQP
jgi:hypothetical protein